ncbi:hypothetical protein OY671_010922, partial [Metschnikowia pulcherrima]
VGSTTSEKGESKKIAKSFEKQGVQTVDSTHDESAKIHIRHKVGGRSSSAEGERLHSFIFPERPGALMTFSTSLPPGRNISSFHFLTQGADYGRISVGSQVPKSETKAIKPFSDGSGYVYVDETRNPVYRLFSR